MPLSGLVDFGSTFSIGDEPSGLFSLIGTDGKHYALARATDWINVACAETNSFQTRTEAQWRTDLTGLALGHSGTAWIGAIIPCPGTAYFYVIGFVKIASGDPYGFGYDEIVMAMYRIDGPSTLTVVGGRRYACGTTGATNPENSFHDDFLGTFGSSETGGFRNADTHGVNVIGSYVYALCGTGRVFAIGDVIRTHALRLPLTETVDIDAAYGSWNAFITPLPIEWQFFNYLVDDRQYSNRAAIIADPSGDIGVLMYVGQSEYNTRTASATLNACGGPACLYITFNPDTHSNSGVQNISSKFGIPFSDTRKDYSGNVSSNGRDDYTSPSVIGSSTELIFIRGYSGSFHQYARMRRFVMSGTHSVTPVDDTTFQFTAQSITQNVEFVMAYRESSELFIMGRDNARYLFGSIPLATPDIGGSNPVETIVPDPIFLHDGGREPVTRKRLVNMYQETTPQGPSEFTRYQRPGLYSVATRGNGPIRATFRWNDFRFTVSDTRIYRDSIYIGDIVGTGAARFAYSDEEVVVVSGGYAWLVSLTGVTLIQDPDLPDNVIDVAFLAGRFVYIVAGTTQFYWSALNDAASIDGLDFATAAENTADHLVGIDVLVDQLVFFTQKVIEWWYTTSDPDAPFQRSPGRKNDKGLVSNRTVILLDNSLFFLGYDKIVYRTGSVPIPISDYDVMDELRRVTVEDLAEASAFGVTFGGHLFYVLFIPGMNTWAYDIVTKSWAIWKSWGRSRFRVMCADENFLGDVYTGQILGFDGAVYTDLDNDPIERVIQAFLPVPFGTKFNSNVSIRCRRGVGLPTGHGDDPVVEMRFSDGETRDWGNWMEATLGIEGDRTDSAKAIWTQLGMMTAPGRWYEFRCTDPVPFTAYEIIFNKPRP